MGGLKGPSAGIPAPQPSYYSRIRTPEADATLAAFGPSGKGKAAGKAALTGWGPYGLGGPGDGKGAGKAVAKAPFTWACLTGKGKAAGKGGGKPSMGAAGWDDD